MTEEKREQVLSVQPWGIEIDGPRNEDVLIQCIPGCVMRGAVRAGKPIVDTQNRSWISGDESQHLGQYPPIPGMQLHVNPAKLTYAISDPLSDDEDLCDKIKSVMDRTGPYHSTGRLRGVPTQKGTLDAHRMKTLVREMCWLVDSGYARVVKGAKPNQAAVDDLPGNYLLNPGLRTFSTQPRFEKDFSAWIEQLTKAGG